MIKVFGSINTEDYISYVPEGGETCDQHCFEADYCILTVNNTSKCLELSHVARDNKFVIERGSSGSKVSFKVTLPDNNCPAFTDLNYTLTLSCGEVLSWKQTEFGWEWKQCRDGWKRFDRSDGVTVCMRTFREDIPYATAEANCKEIGAVLTGVASEEECQWIHEELVKCNPTNEYFCFWIDGRRQCPDCDKWTWMDGYTKGDGALNRTTNFYESFGGEDCLSLAWLPSLKPKTINDASCGAVANGYVCGYNLEFSKDILINNMAKS
ncbi:hypothetical protein B9Z55_015653 [Caenorhabditis nigoni]|uniref:C-type lectin domain-containing protein n=1 Tax=Caenorhabditis nigoni TaxID=1611254 RepID=A0A2G5UC12_9PELO|nr:hypothetical protein B9Z55_015653 [Caenorhabditis nigoni]